MRTGLSNFQIDERNEEMKKKLYGNIFNRFNN